METINKTTHLEDNERLIELAYAEKKGREAFGSNPYTCYVAINSPKPDLSLLSESLLSELAENYDKAFVWARSWDKTIVSISPTQPLGCFLMSTDDIKGKMFVPVMTNLVADQSRLLQGLSRAGVGQLVLNNQETTVDAFMICYFHMLNELVWDLTLDYSNGKDPTEESYLLALIAVKSGGFEVSIASTEDLLKISKNSSRASLRIYGSKINKYVPQVMGAVVTNK